MESDSQAAPGIELVERNPNDGENSAWVAGEIYQSATPAQWDNVPIAFFRRQGNNKLIVGDDLYSSSVLKELGSVEPSVTDESQTTIGSLDLHVRTDGIYLWSPSSSKGIRIPVDTIATYAPVTIGSDSTEALLLYTIPDTDTNDDEDGFSPSMLYHIIPAISPSDNEIPEIHRDTGANCSPALQAILKAITSSQDHLPPPDDEPHPALFGGVSAFTAGQEIEVENDAVRIPGLENFSGWVTSENIEEVMRNHNINFPNGDLPAVSSDGDSALDGLGPGAGLRRQRDEGAEEEDGERVTIWQRTDDV